MNRTTEHRDLEPLTLRRDQYSDWALEIIDQRGLTSPDDPLVMMIALLDALRSRLEKEGSTKELRAIASHFEKTLASAQVEFSRIDLALDSLNKFTERLDDIEKRFTKTTDKILRQNVASIAINHLLPVVYVLFGVALSFALQKLLGRL